MKKNPGSPVGTGPRGHGVLQGRYPQDGLNGRNANRRQLDIHSTGFDSQTNRQGAQQLRPGLWRLIFDSHDGDISTAAWFRVNERAYWLNNIPGIPTEGLAEPIPWVVGFRELFVDGDCLIYWCIPATTCLTFVMISELDEP